MIKKREKVIIVTGGSSGIGRCTAIALKTMGHKVYEFSRRSHPIAGIQHLHVDVTDVKSVNQAITRIYKEAGTIDIVINCAGFGISGAIEFTETAKAKEQFEVNFFGTVNVNRAVLPIMRNNGKGKIINISSVAAVAHIPFQAFYSASKAAIESYTCALDNEVKPYGVRVTAIQLGDIHTGFTQARQKVLNGDIEYGGRISRSVSQMEKDEESGMSPEYIGKYIARIAASRHIKPVYTAGFTYKFLSLVCKLLPCRMRNWIVGQVYAK